MDEVQQNQPKRNRFGFSLSIPIDLNTKLEYIKKRTFLSKQQIVLMLCSKGIEGWCKTLMDEEISMRINKEPSAQVKKARPVQNKPLTAPSLPAASPVYSNQKIEEKFGYECDPKYALPEFPPVSPPIRSNPTGYKLPAPSNATNKVTPVPSYGSYDPWTVPLDNKR